MNKDQRILDLERLNVALAQRAIDVEAERDRALSEAHRLSELGLRMKAERDAARRELVNLQAKSVFERFFGPGPWSR